MKKKIKYGSAVLTALQAQHKSIEEIGSLTQHRRLRAFINGGNSEEWLKCFWQHLELIKSPALKERYEKQC